jgi:hypothetical protein
MNLELRPVNPAVQDMTRAMFKDAVAAAFPGRSVARNEIEKVTTWIYSVLHYEAFIRKYDMLCRMRSRFTEEWWLGLRALAAYGARRDVAGIGDYLKPGQGVDVETWWKQIFAKNRTIEGKHETTFAFPQSLFEDPKFMADWAEAVRMPAGDPREDLIQMTALFWDTLEIPLRFWSDSAAHAFLTEISRTRGGVEISLDTYRKDIRGDRAGLHLIPPVPRHTVVKWKPKDHRTLRVSAKAADAVGVRIGEDFPETVLAFRYQLTK